MRYFTLLKKRADLRRLYIADLEHYRGEIEKFFKNKLGNVEVRFFGSVMTENFDAESDVDVLVISPNTPQRLYERSKLIAELKSLIGFTSPFEVHLITYEEYEGWYKNFIH